MVKKGKITTTTHLWPLSTRDTYNNDVASSPFFYPNIVPDTYRGSVTALFTVCTVSIVDLRLYKEKLNLPILKKVSSRESFLML